MGPLTQVPSSAADDAVLIAALRFVRRGDAEIAAPADDIRRVTVADGAAAVPQAATTSVVRAARAIDLTGGILPRRSTAAGGWMLTASDDTVRGLGGIFRSGLEGLAS